MIGKTKRVLGLVMALCMVLILLPMAALAADVTYDLWVDGTQVTDENAANVLGDGTVSYDADSNTLTLNGATLDTAYSDGSDSGVVFYKGTELLVVEVKRNNSIATTEAAGINAYGPLTLRGDGSLKVSTAYLVAVVGANVLLESGTYDLSSTGTNAIYSYGADGLTITGTANVTATSETSDTICAENEIVFSGNAVVNTTSGSACGIFTPGTLTISENANVTASGDLQGMQVRGGIEITGGTVSASGVRDAAIYACGCDMRIAGAAAVTCSTESTGFALVVGSSSDENSLTVEGQAKLIATDIAGKGIFTGDDFTVSGNAVVETVSTYSYGDVTFSDQAAVTANTGAMQTNAICAVGKLTISGSGVRVTATSEAEPAVTGAAFPAMVGFAGVEIAGGAQVNAASENASAIYANSGSELVIQGSGTVVKAETGNADQAALFGTGAISVTDGAAVEASGAGAGIFSNAADEKVTISGSTVQVALEDPASKWGIYGAAGTEVTDSWLDLPGNDGLTTGDNSVTNSVMFEGDTGNVYGNVTVPGDVEIPAGKKLNVPENGSLTVPQGTQLTNNGTIVLETKDSGLTNSGSLINNGTIQVPEEGKIENDGSIYDNGNISGTVEGNAPITPPATYAVKTAETENGSLSLSHRRAWAGETVYVTATPASGYVLQSLTVTAADGSAVAVLNGSFRMPASSVTVSAVFAPAGLPFTDVPADAWYYDAVCTAYASGLMSGIGTTTFGPDVVLTRGMAAVVLWQLEGKPQVNYALQYADVAEGVWYTEAIRWAASEQLMVGYSAETFGPNDPLTREQLAAVLYRWVQQQGGGLQGVWAFPLTYADAASVSDWAYEALCWLTMQDVVNGVGGNLLAPQDAATRAEAVQMLVRLMAVLAK